MKPRSRGGSLVLLALAWLLLVAGAVDAAPALDLGNSRDLGGHLDYLRDPSRSLTLQDLTAPDPPVAFQPADPPDLHLGFTRDHLWLRLALSPAPGPNGDWLLLFDDPLLDEIVVHQSVGGGPFARLELGDRRPFAARPVHHRQFLAPLALETDAETLVLVRIASESALHLRPRIVEGTAFRQASARAEMGFGLLYGALLMLVLLHLARWALTTDPAHGALAVSVAAVGLLIAGLNGHAYQFLWPASPALANGVIPLLAALWMAGMCWFALSLLELRAQAPRLAFALQLALAAAVVTLVLTVMLPYPIAMRISALLGVLNAGLLLAVGVLAWHRALSVAARSFVFAWSVYALGAGILASSRFGRFAEGALIQSLAMLAVLGAVLFLSFELSERMRRRNRELVGQLRAMEEQATSRAMELRTANEQLKHLSGTDSLTGLASRRRFEQHLAHEWQRAMRNVDPVSLLICRLDELRAFTDHFGEPQGDALLKAVGDVLAGSLRRAGDQAARLSREEFAVVLPATDLEGAMAVAKVIQRGMRTRGFANAPGCQQPFVTLAIGVASLAPGGEGNPEHLQRLAGKAALEARHRGHNAIRSAHS